MGIAQIPMLHLNVMLLSYPYTTIIDIEKIGTLCISIPMCKRKMSYKSICDCLLKNGVNVSNLVSYVFKTHWILTFSFYESVIRKIIYTSKM